MSSDDFQLLPPKSVGGMVNVSLLQYTQFGPNIFFSYIDLIPY